MIYNPLEDSFVTYEAVEPKPVTLNFPLGNLDLDWASDVIYTDSGDEIPIVKPNTTGLMIEDEPTPWNPSSSTEASPKQTTSQPDYSGDSKLSLQQIFEEEGIPIRITSSFRQGDTKSNHSKKDEYGHSQAHDIVPLDGDFNSLLNQIYNNPRIVNWLESKGYGILEETESKNGKFGYLNANGQFTATRATGRHLHIGPDSGARRQFNERTKKKVNYFFGKTNNPEKEFVDVMKPIYERVLKRNGYSTKNLDNILKQAALESGYGLSPRGNGYNLAGIKFFNQEGRTGTNGYLNFNDLEDFADYHVNLLNSYGALDANNLEDFSRRLHGQNPEGKNYSAQGASKYYSKLNGMTTINRYLNA